MGPLHLDVVVEVVADSVTDQEAFVSIALHQVVLEVACLSLEQSL